MFFGKKCCQERPINNCLCMQEVYEPGVEKCINKDYFYTVKHICPIHTKVINKHIINHEYEPQYSCSEENVVIDNGCGCPGNNFMNF